MYVYKITPNKPFTGGCALVSARSVDEAIKKFCEDDYYDYIYDYGDCTCNLLHDLDYLVEQSCVIFNEIYCE